MAILAIDLGKFPWIALLLAGTMGFYGLIKKKTEVDSVTGLTAESLILFLPALLLISFFGVSEKAEVSLTPEIVGLLVGTGIVTAVPLIWFSFAAKRINLSTLGFFQYIGPTINFFLAVHFYGESFSTTHLCAFGFVWAGLALYTWGGLRGTRRLDSTIAIPGSKPSSSERPWYAKRLTEIARISVSEWKRWDGVLVDDSKLNQINWKHDAKRGNKEISVYGSVDEFLDAVGSISKETPLYIDRHLDRGVVGDDLARYLKEELGFKEIYVTTGDPCNLECPPWLNGIIGKRAPWRESHA